MDIKLTGTVFSTSGLRTTTARADGTQGLILSVTVMASRGNHLKRKDIVTGKEYDNDIFTCDFYDAYAQSIAPYVVKNQPIVVYGELLQTEYQASNKRVRIAPDNPMYATLRQFVGAVGCPLQLAQDQSILMDADIPQRGTSIKGSKCEFPATLAVQGTQSFVPASNVPQATSFAPVSTNTGFVPTSQVQQQSFVPQSQVGFVPQSQVAQAQGVQPQANPQAGFVPQTTTQVVPQTQAGFVPQTPAPTYQPPI